MRNLSPIFSIAALAFVVSANSPASAAEYLYNLNGGYADSLGNGPDLVPYGGTLTPSGYVFGANQGLSLSNVINPGDVYSIEIRFFFDSINATFDGYQRIVDFKNRASDTGFYSLNGNANFFGAATGSPAFAPVTFTDLLLTRDASGLFTASVNGSTVLSFTDLSSLATFSGPNNIGYFFVDDLESLATHPTQLEAGTGFIDFIKIDTTSAVPEPATWLMMILGFAGVGFARRKRKIMLSAV